jgi:hypothetical protein
MINKTNIKRWNLKFSAILSLSVFWTVGLNRNHILAQSNIVSDDTLGEERSRVVPFNGNMEISIQSKEEQLEVLIYSTAFKNLILVQIKEHISLVLMMQKFKIFWHESQGEILRKY